MDLDDMELEFTRTKLLNLEMQEKINKLITYIAIRENKTFEEVKKEFEV